MPQSPPESPLQALLIKQIEASGPLGLDAFMQLCLHHDPHGYYFGGGGFGREGDFITAPEISPLFGKALAKWVEEEWRHLGEPRKWRLVELGPGRGTLMAQVLDTLQIPMPILQMVEASPALQAQITKRLGRDITFVSDLGHLPESDVPTLFIGNEYLDALPIRQFKNEAGEVLEICVGLDPGQNLQFQIRHPSFSLSVSLSEGTFGEICPAALSHVQFLCSEIGVAGGAALLIDYGYEMPPKTPTFQAVRKHEKVSPLTHLGEADLTALVDFAALRSLVRAEGLEPQLESQQDLLTRLGFETLLQTHPEETAAAARLIRPDAMGTLFKALSFRAPAPKA